MTGVIIFVGFVLASGCLEMWCLARAASKPTPTPRKETHRDQEDW